MAVANDVGDDELSPVRLRDFLRGAKPQPVVAVIRAGAVYNNGKYLVGTSFVGKNYNYHRNNFSLDNGFGTLQIYVGFNFNLRKEYRRKNTR